MRIDEIRAMPTETLRSELDATQKELFNLRFQKATQQLANTNTIRTARKKVAQIQTVLRQRELAGQA
jgi:large subunit ribosomal protein L29